MGDLARKDLIEKGLIIRVRARSGRLRPAFTVEKGAPPGEGSAGLFVTGLWFRLTHADSLREYDVIHEGRLFLAGWDGLRAVTVTPLLQVARVSASKFRRTDY
jgi:hypothetical protein